MNKVRLTCKTHTSIPARDVPAAEPLRDGSHMTHQVVLLVVHLGRVSPHAVDRQQQVHEGEGRVQPQQVGPEHAEARFQNMPAQNELRYGDQTSPFLPRRVHFSHHCCCYGDLLNEL